MNEDVADGLLLDVRELSLADLQTKSDGSALTMALERFVSLKPSNNSFNSSI